MKKSSKFQLVQRITIKSPLIPRSCEKIGLVLFRVIPAKAGIQCFHWLQILWTPVFTGETNRIDFFTPSPFSKGETPSPPFGVFSLPGAGKGRLGGILRCYFLSNRALTHGSTQELFEGEKD